MFNISELRYIRDAVTEREDFWHDREKNFPTPYGREVEEKYRDLHKKINDLITKELERNTDERSI